jgi:ribonuclease E
LQNRLNSLQCYLGTDTTSKIANVNVTNTIGKWNPDDNINSSILNSGKATTERNIEDMALKINIEAALEIARQVRLRDIGGLIVIDFIDMLSVRNRKTVENAVRSAFAADRAKVQFARISIFGLLELSRQRLRSSLMDVSTASCPACKGSGKIRSSEVVVNSIFRTIEGVIHLVTSNKITILCSREIGLALRNAKKQLLLELAKANAIEIDVKDDNSLLQEEFKIIEVMADATQNKVIAENTPPAVALVAEETSTMPQDDGAVPNYRFVKKKSREYDPSNKRRDGDRRDGQRRDRGPRRDGDKPYVKHGKGSIKKPVKSTGIFGAIKKFFS